MNAKPTRMLFAAAALSAFAAVLAGTANARLPEGAGVPAQIYAASTSPVTSQQQSQQTSVREKLGEIGAWAVPSSSLQKPQLLQRTSVHEKLGEIGAWAVRSSSPQEPQLLQRTSVQEKLGEIGAWASLDPAIKGAIMARSK